MPKLPVSLIFAACAGLAVQLAPARAADAAAGKTVFERTCSICHSVKPGQNKIGPTLFGVVGRQSGTVPGYAYSAAMKSAGLTWNRETLNKYLEAPHAMVPKTKMYYPGLKDAAKRAALIEYLATLK